MGIRAAWFVGMILASLEPASAQAPSPRVTGFFPGHCTTLMLAGQQVGCSKARAALYALLGNGRSLISIQSDDGRLVSFAGEKDAQPRPEAYYLYLSHVSTQTHATHSTSDVGGVCMVNMSGDGRVWRTASCQAQDADGAAYSFTFRGSGASGTIIRAPS